MWITKKIRLFILCLFTSLALNTPQIYANEENKSYICSMNIDKDKKSTNSEKVTDVKCISCSDGIQNGDETYIDCGGTLCNPCSPPIISCSSNNQYSLSNSSDPLILDKDDIQFILFYTSSPIVDTVVSIFTDDEFNLPHGSSFYCTDIGIPFYFRIEVFAANGTSTVCFSTFTVYDNSPPVAFCNGITIDLGLGSYSLSEIDIQNITLGSYDSCGINTITASQSTFNCFNLISSPIEVIMSVSDQSGNVHTCSAFINVIESFIPIINNCPQDIVNVNVNDLSDVQIFWQPPTVTDNCPGVMFSSDYFPGYFFPANGIPTLVNYTATDLSGNTAECNFNVTVYEPNLGSIGDFIWHDSNGNGLQDNNETGISNIPVSLTGVDINNNIVNRNTTSNTNGAYIFDYLKEGIYTVSVPTNINITSRIASPTLEDIGGGNMDVNDVQIDSDANLTTGICEDILLSPNEDAQGIDIGYAIYGCKNNQAHNYDALANIDDSSCLTCSDGIKNGDEVSIDCGGLLCIPCPPPVAICFSTVKTIIVGPSKLIFNGPGAADVYKVDASLLDNGSISYGTPLIEIARLSFPVSSSSSSNSTFNWTTLGACDDVIPGGGINNADRGYTWEDCLPVTPSDFNKVRNYKLRITDEFGTSSCLNGKYKIIYSSSANPETININQEDLLSNDENESMFIYPNPGNNNININLNIDFNMMDEYSIKVYDILGREVRSINKIESSVIRIDTGNLPTGSYNIVLKSNEVSLSKMWVKM